MADEKMACKGVDEDAKAELARLRTQDVTGWKVECLQYDRIVGYYMPTSNWNQGKLQERKDRVNYDFGLAMRNVETQVATG